jgi:arsenate reductase (glutaredoxin)
MTVTIYHNPNCGTSRNVLAMIQQSGEEPVVIEYLKNPPSRERLKELIQAMGIPVRKSGNDSVESHEDFRPSQPHMAAGLLASVFQKFATASSFATPRPFA